MPIDSDKKRTYYVLIETNNALEGNTVATTYTLAIERKYGDSPSNWWPAFGGMEKDEADEALKTYPAIYGEVSRQLTPEKPELPCSEAFLRSCNG